MRRPKPCRLKRFADNNSPDGAIIADTFSPVCSTYTLSQEAERLIDFERIIGINKAEAKKLRAWLDKAIAWLEAKK